MDADELKRSLFRMGIPIHKDGKVSRKDLLSLSFKDSGLNVEHIENLGVEKSANSYTFKLHLEVNGSDAEGIQDIFDKNKPRIESNLKRYTEILKLDCVHRCEVSIKSHNDENIWLDFVIHFDFEKIFQGNAFFPFCYQLLEKSYT